MSRLFTLPAGRRSKWIVFLVVFIVFGGVAGAFAGKFQNAQKNETSSFLPGGAESVKALDAVKQYPGGEIAPAVVVYQRNGGLSARDRATLAADRARLNANRPPLVLPAGRPVLSPRGDAAIIVQPVRAPDNGNSEQFKNAVQHIRDTVSGERNGLTVKVTGGAGYSLDAIKVFGNINGTLLLATALIVLVLLIVIYRSPIFWAIPFFTVLLAEGASRGFGYLIAEAGVTVNGQSGGILPVLVFGAGTDYALLLVSRYREELRRHEDKHRAAAVALRSAGPAILASGLTVIAALLTLSLAEVNGTAGLGPIGAMGVALAMISMLTMLPALLTICGRRAFWSPFFDTIPHLGQVGPDETHGFWRRIGDRVAERPRAVWVTGTIVLAVLALNVLNVDTGLTSSNSFRGEVESVQGQKILARSFPAGSSAPTDVIVPDRSKVAQVRAALLAQRDLVAAVAPPRSGPPGARLSVTLKPDPYSTAALDSVPRLRAVVKSAGGRNVLVGGATAQESDLRAAATRDNRVIIPIALVVVFLILAVLLRALLAPLLLVLSVIVSFMAALGVGIFAFDVIFHFPGIDPSLPLLCFVFLVALGIDYNIFLMARVREEAQRHGTREGTLRGLAVTGAVITGAGIVLAGTFATLAVLPLVFLTEIGFVIAFGVLLDTFIVRSVIVPALAIDLGPRIWWPSAMARAEDEAAPPAPVAERV
ncbi:MAG: putative drug exporter of the superfamily [Solirubrobacteraceae bacterium]|jgi:RND superfamily putative drug exporter|nr:putative drug exporter of the superfamily [Solirubrobacteraceae bacterium]